MVCSVNAYALARFTHREAYVEYGCCAVDLELLGTTGVPLTTVGGNVAPDGADFGLVRHPGDTEAVKAGVRYRARITCVVCIAKTNQGVAHGLVGDNVLPVDTQGRRALRAVAALDATFRAAAPLGLGVPNAEIALAVTGCVALIPVIAGTFTPRYAGAVTTLFAGAAGAWIVNAVSWRALSLLYTDTVATFLGVLANGGVVIAVGVLPYTTIRLAGKTGIAVPFFPAPLDTFSAVADLR